MRLNYTNLLYGLILISCGRMSKDESKKAVSALQESVSSDDWFTARCELLCDEWKGRNLDIKKLKKYGVYNPYDFTQMTKQDSAVITFDFISDCCMDFAGRAHLKGDTLILGYHFANDSIRNGCDCFCDYRMTYRIYKQQRSWTAIKPVFKRQVNARYD